MCIYKSLKTTMLLWNVVDVCKDVAFIQYKEWSKQVVMSVQIWRFDGHNS